MNLGDTSIHYGGVPGVLLKWNFKPMSSPSEKNVFPTGCWWLKPVILATWEAKIRRITIQGHLGK
jgi:hypothetical protein